ncbi:MAG: protein kinase, partial [Planctomycetes bacterium]|nr:protein kinase [Planctomycetota bacterium]
ARAATSSSHLTMSGQIMGTPHYMSPEQAESKEVSDKSDVYSLGVTLYHMLTGETPFVGDTPISVAVQHIAKEIIYPEIRFKPFPKELVAVLKRMTAKDAAKRCSAKQAAVWLRKLIGMAPQDDIAAGDEGAMKSMAPVVRESQAFEAAAKEREQRDHHARELAQTMLATIQEDSARRAAIPQPTQEASQPSSSQVIIERRGSGGLVAVLLLLIIVGGGGAAWYFTLGPGAVKDNKSDQPIAAANGNDASNTSSVNTSTNSAGNSGTVGTDAGPADGGATDGGTVDGGTTDGIADDGGAIDGGSVDGTELPPPEEVDDPAVAGYLGGALTSITNANTLADLDPVKRKLDQAWLVIKQGKGSEKQRAEFDELKARYDQQRAYLAATEGFAKIRTALASFEEKRGDDNDSAIDFLNTAIKERDRLLAIVVPDAAKELVADDRDALVERVNDALESFWTELDKEATRLEGQNQFDGASEALAAMERIDNTPEALAGVRDRRKVVQIRGLHKSILDDLDIPDFKDAASLVKKAEEIGVPDSLKTAHAQVKAAMASKIEETVQNYLADAKAGVVAEDFIAARNALDAATELPEKTPEQKTQVADMVFFVTLSEQLLNADKAIEADNFVEARKQLDEAKLTLDGAQNRTVPQELKDRYATLSGSFDTQLSSRFEELLSAAKSKLEDRDFESASKSMNDADKLPLTTAQRERLDTFKADSLIALDQFVRELISKIEKALDDNEFDKAQAALATADALPV